MYLSPFQSLVCHRRQLVIDFFLHRPAAAFCVLHRLTAFIDLNSAGFSLPHQRLDEWLLIYVRHLIVQKQQQKKNNHKLYTRLLTLCGQMSDSKVMS